MHNQNFVFWKLPGDTIIYTIANPVQNKITEIQLNEEGFVIFPFNNLEPGYSFIGKIMAATSVQMPKMDLETAFESNINHQEHYMNLVNKSLIKIKEQQIDKVVLARKALQNMSNNFEIEAFFIKLCTSYQNALVYCIGFNDAIWIGATPEILLKAYKNLYTTYALAGTQSINTKNIFGNKEKLEQDFVKKYIVETLTNHQVTDLKVSDLNEIKAGNVRHLFNSIQFKTNHPQKILKDLHPTPAICGMPKDSALKFINDFENFNREYYSGYLGPIKQPDHFDLFVNLRCAKITQQNIELYAGAGITEDSIPKLEWEETEKKMDTLRNFL